MRDHDLDDRCDRCHLPVPVINSAVSLEMLLAQTEQRVAELVLLPHDRHLLPVVDRDTGETVCHGDPGLARYLWPFNEAAVDPIAGPYRLDDEARVRTGYGRLVDAALRLRV